MARRAQAGPSNTRCALGKRSAQRDCYTPRHILVDDAIRAHVVSLLRAAEFTKLRSDTVLDEQVGLARVFTDPALVAKDQPSKLRPVYRVGRSPSIGASSAARPLGSSRWL